MMNDQRKRLSMIHAPKLAALLLWAVVCAAAAPVAADDLAAPSLALVPQDAASYSAMLRLGEQIEIVSKSNWWKRLSEWDLVQQMRAMIEAAIEQQAGDVEPALQLLELPENQQLIQVLQEMMAEEVFCYADHQVSDSVALAMEVANGVRYGSMFYELTGRESGLSEEEFMAKLVLDMLADDVDRVAVPALVVGFGVQDKAAAATQLKRLEVMVKMALKQVPELQQVQNQFQRTKVGDAEYLTLTLDGAMVPWHEIPFEDLEDQPGQYDKLKKKLGQLKLAISLGVQKGYVILSLGPSNDHLAKLGQGTSLADHPKLAPLRAHPDRRYTGIGYVSKEFMQSMATKPEDIDQLADVVQQVLAVQQEVELEAGVQERIVADAKELANDLKPFIPEVGAQLSFSFLTDRGIEGYQYNWSENIALDGSKPLGLLNHLGGSPLLAVLARGQQRPGDYDLLVKWLKKARGYFDQLAVPEMAPHEREQYQTVMKLAEPILTRIDKVNRTMLIPALTDGQAALVIDGDMKSSQWLESAPATTEPVAIPAPALVLGVSDADLFKQALGEYRGIINQLIGEVRKLDPNGVPDVELPPAKVRALKNGAQVYYYPLPEDLGVYDKVAPNIAVTDKLACLSLAPRQSVAVVGKRALAVDGGPIAAKAGQPLAAAVYFDWNGLVDVALPWVNEGVRVYVRSMEEVFNQFDDIGGALRAPGDSDTTKQILSQVKKGAKFLKVLKTYSGVSYVEDGAVVTHGETRFVDLK